MVARWQEIPHLKRWGFVTRVYEFSTERARILRALKKGVTCRL